VRLVTVAFLLAAPLAAEAQQAGKVYRLGILNPAAPPARAQAERRDFVSVLRETGYVEGQNLTVERRYADGRVEQLPAFAAELVARRVDLIQASSPVAFRAAQGATKTIPIVFLLAGSDPVELGFVRSLAQPGGNATGVVLGSMLADKRLKLLKEAVPGANRIAMLSAGESSGRVQVQEAERAAAVLGVRLVVVEAQGRDYERAFATIRGERADAVFVGASPVLNNDRGRIIELAARYRLPAIYQWPHDPAVGVGAGRRGHRVG
jgi:putative ABC transport system substrate-binding protein